MKVKCEACGHPAELAADELVTWMCNCHAGVGREAVRLDNPEGCRCDHVNEIDTTKHVLASRVDDAGNVTARELVDLSNPPAWLDDSWAVEAD